MSKETNLREIKRELQEAHEKKMAMLTEHYDLLQDILFAMPKESVAHVWVDNCFNIAVAGGKPVLTAAIRALRVKGYIPSTKPLAGQAEYSSYFRQMDKPNIWFTFTSTQCRRVKVGVRTVVQDVYEIVCDDQIYEEAG